MHGCANKPPISVVADDREARGRLLDVLKGDPLFRVESTRLSVGDYLVDQRFVFERKTTRDLAASVISGRLFSQALRLVEQPLHAALVVEGASLDRACGRMSREALQGALVSVSLMIGVPVLHTRNAEESAALFRYSATQAAAVAVGALPRRGYRPKGKAALQSFILQGLPGVGPELARRLIDRFGNVRRVIGAEAETLQTIDGIGPKTAGRIDWAVRECLPPYQQPQAANPCIRATRRPAAVSRGQGGTPAAGTPS